MTIVSAAQIVMLGDADVAVAGGAESMSRGQYWVPGLRWGQRLNDGAVVDATVGAVTDPFDDCHMGVTAENVAGKWHVTREDQDALAVESHRRAARALANGYFKDQIVPVEVKTKAGPALYDTDEHVRADASPAAMASRSSTERYGDRREFRRHQRRRRGGPDGRSAADAAPARSGSSPMPMPVDPKYRKRPEAKRAVELSDGGRDADTRVSSAFAAQALAVARDLGLPEDRTNPNGSGISLGHPIGATGCILTVKALYELQRVGGRYALVTMCIGGGQGIAAIYERM
jgi:acetyl-CoA C-acetyltransferase